MTCKPAMLFYSHVPFNKSVFFPESMNKKECSIFQLCKNYMDIGKNSCRTCSAVSHANSVTLQQGMRKVWSDHKLHKFCRYRSKWQSWGEEGGVGWEGKMASADIFLIPLLFLLAEASVELNKLPCTQKRPYNASASSSVHKNGASSVLKSGSVKHLAIFWEPHPWFQAKIGSCPVEEVQLRVLWITTNGSKKRTHKAS